MDVPDMHIKSLSCFLKLIANLTKIATFDFLNPGLANWLVAPLLMLCKLPPFLEAQITQDTSK
jgi:hypothetical protein